MNSAGVAAYLKLSYQVSSPTSNNVPVIGGTVPSELIVQVTRLADGSLKDATPFLYTSPTVTDAENNPITFTSSASVVLPEVAFSSTASTFSISVDKTKVTKSQSSTITVSISDGIGSPVMVSILLKIEFI